MTNSAKSRQHRTAKHTDIGITANHKAQTAPDGGKTRAAYNKTHGRKANAPTLGGDRQAAYDALLSPEGKRVPVAYLG